jgi:hypothetical protein
MHSTYLLQANDTIWGHGFFKQWFVKDFDTNHLDDLKAQVASGDYFITLATKLDDLSQQLAEIHPAGHIILEKIIADLSYLQNNYRIKR